jgi:hypothetical protein
MCGCRRIDDVIRGWKGWQKEKLCEPKWEWVLFAIHCGEIGVAECLRVVRLRA